MRAVVQRVLNAGVTVDDECVGKIGRGYLVLLGVGHGDTRAEAEAVMADCENRGRRGLACYKCEYCGGWHLTSHLWK
ncbi:MAG: D-aminoacyl-tRNA deacylase [Collinsella sp.]|nr:D-aminoacyl-tRNA deacylase [Collinsella sp.]